jgi:hypothetical protein
MQLCHYVTTGFETLAGSEPLLAEAACHLLHDSSTEPVSHLANHSNLHCIDCGGRGELVAALIIMQARDAASMSSGRRWVSVGEFMEALLPKEPYEALLGSPPTFWRAGEKLSFDDTFRDYAMWFNHVIRIDDASLIDSKHLRLYITRGAMVVFTHKQCGVDIVLPICPKEGSLSCDTVSAILIQVTDAKKYGRKINKVLFDAMAPAVVGLLDKDSPPRPVIRMVFALAAEQPRTEKSSTNQPGTKQPLERKRPPVKGDKFTSFDIWCPGLGPDTFKNLGDDLTSYKILLARSFRLHDVFHVEETKDEDLDALRKEFRKKQRQSMAPLTITPLGDEGEEGDEEDEEDEDMEMD